MNTSEVRRRKTYALSIVTIHKLELLRVYVLYMRVYYSSYTFYWNRKIAVSKMDQSGETEGLAREFYLCSRLQPPKTTLVRLWVLRFTGVTIPAAGGAT